MAVGGLTYAALRYDAKPGSIAPGKRLVGRFRALPKAVQRQLSEKLAGFLRLVCADGGPGFKHAMVSVFDDLLSETEVRAELQNVEQAGGARCGTPHVRQRSQRCYLVKLKGADGRAMRHSRVEWQGSGW